MPRKEFYLRKLGKRGKITIWLVDGGRIRSELEEEFTNFGQHFRFSCIPEYEFWIDKEAVPDERQLFVDHLLIEWRLMKNGAFYAKATDTGSAKERSERKKTRDLKKVVDGNGVPQVEAIRVRLLRKLDSGISVWLVNGRLVRSVFDIEFTEGGHDLVYDYVPKNEIWLDNDVLAEERPYVLLHELYERSLMAKGITYTKAHRKASKLEWQVRHDQRNLQEKLTALGWNNNHLSQTQTPKTVDLGAVHK